MEYPAETRRAALSPSPAPQLRPTPLPRAFPRSNPSIIHATAGVLVASATVTFASGVTVSVLPPSASIAIGQRATLTPVVTNSSDITVTWTVNGSANGNTTTGQICQHASNPCLPPSAPSFASVDYLAPATLPAPNPVIVTATSHADPSKSGSAEISVTGITGSVAVTDFPELFVHRGNRRRAFHAAVLRFRHRLGQHKRFLDRTKRRPGPGLLRRSLRLHQPLRPIHRAVGGALAKLGVGDCHQPGRSHQIRHRSRRHPQRRVHRSNFAVQRLLGSR